jgi:uncharacterized membrane protein
MKYSKWIGLAGVALLVFASFQPWMAVPSKDIVITGMNTAGTNFGKPALMNIIMACIAAVLFVAPWVMAKRINLFFCGFNIAWCLRNFVVISACRAGECPEKLYGLYLLALASVVMLLCSFFPDVKLNEEKE